jgi:predicted RNase H-like HicB family nuclease
VEVLEMAMKVKVKTKELKFRVPIIIEPDSKGYFAHSPALPGLMMDGDTKEEALQNARDGAIGLLQLMINDGDPIPLNIIIQSKTETEAQVSENKYYYQEEITVPVA